MRPARLENSHKNSMPSAIATTAISKTNFSRLDICDKKQNKMKKFNLIKCSENLERVIIECM
jgi:hypothetical protein